MADSVKLQMTFKCADGKNHNFSYKYADSETLVSEVKTLMNTINTNGSIFTNVPVSAESAKMVVTTETEYDLDD